MANGVSEESDKICYANAKKIACKYTITPDEFGITGYIYLNGAPKTPVSSILPNTNIEENSTQNIEVTKSNNANLSSIELSNGTIDFNKGVSEYYVDVENEIDKITINAKSEDNKSIIDSTGEYELNIGVNEIKLVVTAEDKSTKEYVIKITRKERIKVKNVVNKSDVQQEKEVTRKDNKKIVILISGISFVIVVFCLLFTFNKKKPNKKVK